eukprot:TRINITY_DN928_c0_g2_i1.p1 TRINITY_DN928_c0_g2~~TRINITY_DN928_c0_g2_i1.p1  ORF type:complete len:269 (+),score=36.07 TRINITY_DN928_c0_g2_i1:87-893(+)
MGELTHYKRYELSLHGAVMIEENAELHHRLVYMCEESKAFMRHEMIFKPLFPDQIPPAARGELRGWCDFAGEAEEHPQQWYLRYYVKPVVTLTTDCLVRSFVDIPVTTNFQAALSALDFQFDYEYVSKGNVYVLIRDHPPATVPEVARPNDPARRVAPPKPIIRTGGSSTSEKTSEGDAEKEKENERLPASAPVEPYLEVRVFSLLKCNIPHEHRSLSGLHDEVLMVQLRAIASSETVPVAVAALLKASNSLQQFVQFEKVVIADLDR